MRAEPSEGKGSNKSSDSEEDDLLLDIKWTGVALQEGAPADDDVEVVDGVSDDVGRRRKRRKGAGRKRKRVELVHRMDLLCRLGRALARNSECESEEAFAVAKDAMPDPFVRLETARRVRALVSWFSHTFESVETHDARTLTQVLRERRGSQVQLAQAFVALTRSTGNPTRLVAALSPKPRIAAVRRGRGEGNLPLWWVEVHLCADDESGFVCVDLVNRAVDSPHKFDESVSYVVALGPGNFVVDVTGKYAKQWTKTAKARHSEKDGWWETFTLQGLREKARSWIKSCSYLSETQREQFEGVTRPCFLDKENQKLTAAKEEEQMPTNIDDFRRHKKFILEKHLSRNQGVLPDCSPAGYFKGISVFLRTDVKELLTKTQWRKAGKEVREDQIEAPAKLVDPYRKYRTFADVGRELDNEASATSSSAEVAKIGEENGEGRQDLEDEDDPNEVDKNSGKIRLYGDWQTKPYEPPVLGPDGKIPKNSYGNVEMWSELCCPVGAAHLKVQFGAKAAKQLGIDFAMALVGFENQNFRRVPKYDGIVVAQNHVQLVTDAAASIAQDMLEKQIKKRQQRIIESWERLVKGVLIEQRIKNQYDTGNYYKNNPQVEQLLSSHGSQPTIPAQILEESSALDVDGKHCANLGRNQVCDHNFVNTGQSTVEGVEKRCTACGLQKIVEEL